MQAINLIIANLQEELSQIDTTAQTGGKELPAAIANAHEIMVQTKNIAKGLNNNQLVDFLNANVVILYQLHSVALNPDPENHLLAKSSAIMQQLSHMYQDIIVPMLTRLHNLLPDSADLQKITAITSLGNEIITYSAQINQFSDKFSIHEKIVAMFGILLMLSSISMMVAILTKPRIEFSLFTTLTIVALGCTVCRKAMQAHVQDPGTDLIATSVKKMEPLICDIAKEHPEEQTNLREILHGKNYVHVEPLPKPSVERKRAAAAAAAAAKLLPIVEAVESIPEPEVSPEPDLQLDASDDEQSPSLMNKLKKGMFDLFQNKK